MPLELKRQNEVIPQYSLTGDLLSFLRCGLQYRYHNGSSLPPSRPVQLWFGEFIHGVMENAFRIWRAGSSPFPWPSNPTPYRQAPPQGRLPHDIGTIGDTVEATLRARGKNPRSADLRNSAYQRAEVAVNELGAHLFPLISSAEEKVIGTRSIPPSPPGNLLPPRATLYEVHGIIDVVTDIQLTGAEAANEIRRAIQESCPQMNGRFEVIVDYKGSRRPAITHDYWHQGEWQLQTYAWLRMRQPSALPVAAGVLLYINELAPVASDIAKLQHEVLRSETDRAPVRGTQDAYQLSTWRQGSAVPSFSLEYRLQRAIRVIPINVASQTTATGRFDQVVLDIEQCVSREASVGTIVANWSGHGDEETCVACDFRHFCPSPTPRPANYVVQSPSAP